MKKLFKILCCVATVIMLLCNINYVEAEGSYWDLFYNKFLNVLNDDVSLDLSDVVVTSNAENQFSIVAYDRETDQDYTTIFRYDSGIVSYVKGDNTAKANQYDLKWINYAITAVAEMKGYNTSHFASWFASQDGNTATVGTNGFEFKHTTNTVTSFKIDVCNGFKLYDPNASITPSNVPSQNPETPATTPTVNTPAVTEENPNTGIAYGISLVVIVAVFSSLFYSMIFKKNRFPQV